MITPTFSCSQDESFVIVVIYLSTICKTLDSVFDISGSQFTFYCSPYYLRIRFDQPLKEGAGERATYNLETQQLTVYIPKGTRGEDFSNLDNIQYLIATEKQRKVMRRLITEVKGSDEDEDDDESDDEFVQDVEEGSVKNERLSLSGTGQLPTYGFANAFSGVFRRLDADLVREVLELSQPDVVPNEQRRLEQVTREQSDFQLEAVLISLEDEDGEVARLLRYVPEHVAVFQRALTSDNVLHVRMAPPPTASVAYEQEEERMYGTEGCNEIWCGNVMDFKKPVLIEEVNPAASAFPPAPSDGSPDVPGAASDTIPPSLTLAIPKHTPVIEFSREESEALLRVKLPPLLFSPSKVHVIALTAEMLFAEAYDDLFSEGTGCCESVWNMCKLTSSLTFLNTPETLYEACYFFARRLFIYPLHRHPLILSRVLAIVGIRMMLGRQYVMRALLRMRSVLSHSEHRHALCTLFLDPLLAYWSAAAADGNEMLLQAAIELHSHASRTSDVLVHRPRKRMKTSIVLSADTKSTVTLHPLTLHFLDLPLEEEQTDD